MKQATCIFLLLGLALVVAPAQEQEWYKYYDDAKKAMDEGRWQDAVDSLLISIKRNPNPGTNVKTHGTFVIDYCPHFKLAYAYYQQHLYQSAETKLKEAQTLEVKRFAKDKDYQRDFAKLQQDVAKALEQAKAATPPTKPAYDPAMKEQLDKAEDLYTKGDYDGAKAAYNRVKTGKSDPAWVQQAEGRISEIEAELRDWQEGQRLYNAGSYDEAIKFLSAVVNRSRHHAGEAGKLREDAINHMVDSRSDKKSLQDMIKQARNWSKEGNYDSALATLKSLAPKPEVAKDVQQAQNEIRDRLARTAAECLDKGDLKGAEKLFDIVKAYDLSSDQLKNLQERLANHQKMALARHYIAQKQWTEAEKLCRELERLPEFQKECRQYLAKIESGQERLRRDLADADTFLKAGKLDEATQLAERLQGEFPSVAEVKTLVAQVREARSKSGRTQVEEFLKMALEDFFDTGNYQQSRVYFTEYLKKNGTQKDKALYFRALTNIYLARLSSEDRQGFLDEAKRDIAALSRTFQPPRQWISPKVLELVERWRREK